MNLQWNEAVFDSMPERDRFWAWYHEHENDMLVDKSILGIIHLTIRVKDLHWLFVRIFGVEPAIGVVT